MSHPIYYVPAGDVLPIFFSTYDGGTGASLTMSGLAVTDVEIYKDGSTTQRASDAGFTLLDTDGIDFDGVTGIHGFSIDTGDNTDASFYTVGAWFTVVVSSVTVDAQTVNFIAAQFRIMPAESSAGVPKVDLSHVGGATTNVSALATNVDAILTDTGTTLDTKINTIDDFLDTEIAAIKAKTDNLPAAPAATGDIPTAAAIADAVWDEATAGHTTAGSTGKALTDAGSAGDPWSTALPGAYGAGTAGKIVGDNINATISSRASQTSVDTVDDFLDTEIAAIKAKTDNLPAAPAATGDIPTAAAIADAVWDEATLGHTTSGTFGEQLKTDVDAILVDTDVIGATGGGLTSLATQASVNTIDDLLDTEVAAIKTVVDSILVDTAEIGAAGAGLTAVPWNAAWDAEVQSEATDALNAYDPPTNAELATEINSVQADIAALNNLSAAQVNAEVVDALATDTYAEPGQGAPAATAALSTKLNYLYKSWRNKKDNDGTTTNLYADDATTVDQKQSTSESGGTVTKGEWITGA